MVWSIVRNSTQTDYDFQLVSHKVRDRSLNEAMFSCRSIEAFEDGETFIVVKKDIVENIKKRYTGVVKRGDPVQMYLSHPNSVLQDHELNTTDLSDIPFGREMKKEFGLRHDITFLNHSSFGTVPNRVIKMQHEYNVEREEHPDLFIRVTAKQYMDKTRQEVASTINAKLENIVLVSSVTTAMNVLIKNYPFETGDAILDTSLSYVTIKTLISDFSSRIRPDVERIHLDISFPIQSEDEIVGLYEDILDKHTNIKVAVIDHITCPSALLMPIARLVKMCHSRGVVVFVDGAHSIGQIPLDMEELQPDAFTSNLHKWSYSPRAVALLWFADKHRGWLKPPNTSRLITKSLDDQFYAQGSSDAVPFICARHALQFYDAIGGMEKIVGYTSKLADDARDMLCDGLGLGVLDIPRSMEAPNMKPIKLPPFPQFPVNRENTWHLHQLMFGDTNAFAILFPIQGEFYIRISANVYNDMEDFVKLANILKSFIEKHT